MANEVASAAGDPGDIDPDLFPTGGDLKDAEEVWMGGTKESAKRRPIGLFTAKIVEASLERSASADKLQIHYTLAPIDGIAAGEEIHKYDGLTSKVQASISQQQLKRLGFDTTKLKVATLPAALLTLRDKMVQCKGKINGEFYNINIVKYVGTNLADTNRAGNAGGAGGAGGAKGHQAPTRKTF